MIAVMREKSSQRRHALLDEIGEIARAPGGAVPRSGPITAAVSALIIASGRARCAAQVRARGAGAATRRSLVRDVISGSMNRHRHAGRRQASLTIPAAQAYAE